MLGYLLQLTGTRCLKVVDEFRELGGGLENLIRLLKPVLSRYHSLTRRTSECPSRKSRLSSPVFHRVCIWPEEREQLARLVRRHSQTAIALI
ncbi:hypothetical protein TSMEX_003264 [Taenia solium]|eukprot:TsM_001149700 transcript=TsM_001149700 gene=TsM_001149700